MKPILLFDADGLVIKKPAVRPSEHFVTEYKLGASMSQKVQAFFANEFQLCLVGKADLKEVLVPHLAEWGWPRSLDAFLEYWFSGDSSLDTRFPELIKRLRGQGIRCFLATNNEKYRTAYLIKKLNLRKLFDDIFPSCDIGARKSKKLFWETVHSKIGSPPKSDVAVWDDDEENVSVASAFGYDAHFYSGFSSLTKWLDVTGL